MEDIFEEKKEVGRSNRKNSDIVRVVRCSKCIYYKNPGEFGVALCTMIDQYVHEGEYCSRGKRNDGTTL